MRTIAFLTIFISAVAYSQPCDCRASYQWLKKTIEENDAGFSAVLKEKGTELYRFHNTSFEKKIKAAKDLMVCSELLKSWLTFFRKEHLYLFPVSKNSPLHFPKRETDVETFKSTLEKQDYIFIDGIWEWGDYEVVIQQEGNQYLGIVINTGNMYWKKGEIKFYLDKDLKEGILYQGDQLHTPRKLEHIEYLTEGILVLENQYLKRKYPIHPFSEEEQEYLSDITSEKSVFKAWDENTSYLRIPSFAYDKKDEIREMVNLHFSEITGKDHLIIDLRGNGGGADVAFAPLIHFIYTNPIVSMGTVRLASPLNNAGFKEDLDFSQMSQEDVDWYTEKLAELEKNPGEFIDVEGIKFLTVTRDTVYPGPVNIAILTDRYCGSSTEEFLLMAKQSKKVKIYGQPTAGALDISNLQDVMSPAGDFILYYGTTRSIRDYKTDDVGIQPDFYMHQYILKHQWVSYVRRLMD